MFYSAKLKKNNKIQHCFFSRKNGVSGGIYESLNCGIGSATTARDAAKLATQSLDTIREIRDSGKEKPEVYELK